MGGAGGLGAASWGVVHLFAKSAAVWEFGCLGGVVTAVVLVIGSASCIGAAC